MMNLPKQSFERLFGDKGFIPIMCVVQRWMPPLLYARYVTYSSFRICFFLTVEMYSIAYPMFSYLFNWGDSRCDCSRKPKYFQFTPRPVSSKLIAHWGQMCKRGQLVSFSFSEQLEDA